MDIIKLKELLEDKKYPKEFVDDIILFYPLMVRHFGEEKADSFLSEWTIVFNNDLNSYSCATYKDEKKIVIGCNNLEVFWPHRLITTLFHEAGHTLGTLVIPGIKLLSQGHERESFFEKMDEAFVSEKQDDILCGQLQYSYIDGYGFKCRGDIQHTDTYAIEKMYYNVFKILLGNKRDLINKYFYETNIEEKQKLYLMIQEELKNELDEEELNTLLDSCVLLIINHMYGTSKSNDCSCEEKINRYLRDLYEYNYKSQRINEKSEEEQKEFNTSFQEYSKEFYNKYYSKAIEYARNRNIIKVDILSQADNLCSMTVDHLIKKMSSTNTIDFETIKEVCEYIVKINNKNVNQDKTNFLIESLYQRIEELDIRFDSEIENQFSHKELLGVIAKIIAIKDINLEALNNIKIVKETDGTVYLNCNNYLIKMTRKLTNDRLRTFDNSLGEVEVNTILPNVKLNYTNGCSIGDEVKLEELVDSNRKLCKIDLEVVMQK